MVKDKIKRVVMEFPAGKYYIGDPCYPVSHSGDVWHKMLDQTNYFKKMGITKVLMWPMFAGSTAYGDGGYVDQYGRDYSVDAGCLGIMPWELVELVAGADAEKRDPDYLIMLGRIETFEKAFKVSYCNDGRFDFGGFMIDTR